VLVDTDAMTSDDLSSFAFGTFLSRAHTQNPHLLEHCFWALSSYSFIGMHLAFSQSFWTKTADS